MTDERVTDTRTGPVCGRVGTDGVARFFGIPYARPPLGTRRWQLAEPVEPWTGVRAANGFGPRCPQPPVAGLAADIWPAEAEAEDCLTLNLWSPAATGGPRPVAVWIHGGGFLSGSAAWPDGTAFARDGIVLVSLNYRLGPLGFLHLNDLFDGFGEQSTANLGLNDQICALRWVADNIAAFGGDPDNVTVFGESAGAISVATLMASERSAGCFRRAILQSGAGHQARSPEAATVIARHFCELAGIEPGNRDALHNASADALRTATLALLGDVPNVEAQLADVDPMGAGMLFMPVVDGHTLNQRPFDAISAGRARGVDTLIGTNADEWRLVVFGAGAGAAEAMPMPDLTRFQDATGMSGAALMQAYRDTGARGSDRDVVCEVLSDLYFNVPATRFAEAQSAHARVYVYRFEWSTPILDGLLGACHGLEIPFVFDDLDGARALVGESAPRDLASVVHGAWVEFMRNGMPSVPQARWPEFTKSKPAVMRLNTRSELDNEPLSRRLALWPEW